MNIDSKNGFFFILIFFYLSIRKAITVPTGFFNGNQQVNIPRLRH